MRRLSEPEKQKKQVDLALREAHCYPDLVELGKQEIKKKGLNDLKCSFIKSLYRAVIKHCGQSGDRPAARAMIILYYRVGRNFKEKTVFAEIFRSVKVIHERDKSCKFLYLDKKIGVTDSKGKLLTKSRAKKSDLNDEIRRGEFPEEEYSKSQTENDSNESSPYDSFPNDDDFSTFDLFEG